MPGIIGSALGQLSGVSILFQGDIESLITTSFLVWQHVQLSEQIRPLDILACCWDNKHPTNSNCPWDHHSFSCIIAHWGGNWFLASLCRGQDWRMWCEVCGAVPHGLSSLCDRPRQYRWEHRWQCPALDRKKVVCWQFRSSEKNYEISGSVTEGHWGKVVETGLDISSFFSLVQPSKFSAKSLARSDFEAPYSFTGNVTKTHEMGEFICTLYGLSTFHMFLLCSVDNFELPCQASDSNI